MHYDTGNVEAARLEEYIRLYRENNPAAARWAAGYGPIEHNTETQARIFQTADLLEARGVRGDGVPFFEILYAADRTASAAMWLVVHETYARNVYLDGRDLGPEDFKMKPEGHTGGALNMVPAYVGYLTINALTGTTRAWIMGQGHTVAAIDSVNLLLNNMTPAHAGRYSVTDEGLTRYVRDFYSYKLRPDGTGQDSPLGSHVNAYTAGGLVDGGYLGFTELQYVHMPLPGERLVAFLSDGAFEEQRGSDWAPRWWRSEDSGIVTPIMINNGRRIDQRTTMSQEGGVIWFIEHLKLNSFNPIVFDGRDPAAFAWAILEMEESLEAAKEGLARGDRYPVLLPYGVAVAPKGAGFYGEGTNLAHNLPLPGNPHTDAVSAHYFNESARRLWVPPAELAEATDNLQHHEGSGRPREKDHPLATRNVRLKETPDPAYLPVPEDRSNPADRVRSSPMRAVDAAFLATVQANPHLRPRVGNPDEMRSNRMLRTLEALKFRVTDPEPQIPEDIEGAVVTALNEETVASAALANKGGINIIVTYEAFGAKMHGEVRQEIIFSNHQNEAGCPPGWLSVPLVLTSHTWENAKNEQSHQDPAMAEAMLGEPSDVSRVLFPADHNTAAAAIHGAYETQGQIWTLVVPKSDVPQLFSPEETARLLSDGALRLGWAGHDVENQQLVLTAVGAYQLEEVLKASLRLAERSIPHSVVYMLEPGKFRVPRSRGEATHAASEELRRELYPDSARCRVFVVHTRPDKLLGVVQPLNTGWETTGSLGFINKGGTLTVEGLLYLNRTSWAHVLVEAARVLGLPREKMLDPQEIAALDGEVSAEGLIL